MSRAVTLLLLVRVCALVREGGGVGGLACLGAPAGAVEVAAAELSGSAEGDAQSGAPGYAGGVDVAATAHRAETLNCAGAARISLSDCMAFFRQNLSIAI
jgi:hypothetical protein